MLDYLWVAEAIVHVTVALAVALILEEYLPRRQK